METKTSPVVLFLADISGYTPFMLAHGKAPVHGQMIIGGLMETLMRHRHVIDLLLRLFGTFRRRLAELAASSICRCDAFANLKNLRIKVVAHSGEALFNQSRARGHGRGRGVRGIRGDLA